MTDYVYINQDGQFARLCEPGHSTKQVVSVTTDINNASVISEHKKASLDCNARLRLNRNFTALPATEQRTVRLETGTERYRDTFSAPVRTCIAGEDLREGDPVVVRQPGDRSEMDWSEVPTNQARKHQARNIELVRRVAQLKTLLRDVLRDMGTAQWALNPETGYQVHRGVLRKRLEELSNRIVRELEK